MKKLKSILGTVYHHTALKYVVVAVLAIVFVGFVDENSMWRHIMNKRYIDDLQEQIDMYNRQYKHDQAQIHLLDSDPKAIEKIARERYFMKADDEDIYVLSDDKYTGKSILNDEAAE